MVSTHIEHVGKTEAGQLIRPKINLLKKKESILKPALSTEALSPQSLTKMRISFPVTAGYVGAAAPISLANSTFIQGVGGEENAITANGLKNAQTEH